MTKPSSAGPTSDRHRRFRRSPSTVFGDRLAPFSAIAISRFPHANIVAQVFAALMPLPNAPTPQDNTEGRPEVDAAVNSSNMIRYQNALALFAKRDQQILTLGSVLKELFKRPGVVMG
jgi:hypothetical protein